MRAIKNRRQFLATLTAGSAVALGATAAAKSDPASTAGPKATGTPPAKPVASPSAKPPSAAALAIAATMRRFDPKLSDAEIATIAEGIDEGASFGAALNPKKKRLRNWDEPVTRFEVPQ
jgi:hypothetical protein